MDSGGLTTARWSMRGLVIAATLSLAGCGTEPVTIEPAATLQPTTEPPTRDAPAEPTSADDASNVPLPLAAASSSPSTPRSASPLDVAPALSDVTPAPTNVARPAERRSTFTDDDYRRHIVTLRATMAEHKLEPDDFHIVIARPFVVIGDESLTTVERRAERTVRWAVERLKQDFFRHDPTAIVDIWLFKDKTSYEHHTKLLFGRRPHTPFGYYSPRDRALVMNISTGGGTLVHEIVHPFVAADFPKCPAWLNEGLGSLFEQCGERDGRIRGETNWRLRGLQRAIAAERVPSFAALCSTSTHEFYQEDPGTNYAQARYLCYYLQEKRLLRTYYHRFRETHERDPTGFVTLQSVLGEEDMRAFQDRWAAWVMELRFPG